MKYKILSALVLFGIGALLAAYISRITENTNSFKANIGSVFLIENTFLYIAAIHMLLDYALYMDHTIKN